MKSCNQKKETIDFEVFQPKKVLILASVISFFEQFLKENILFLKKELNCEVHIATNFNYLADTDEARISRFIETLRSENIVLHNIDFARSPLSYKNFAAYKKIKRLIKDHRFDLIHCHTPTVAMLARIASKKARKQGSVVMYTCHGFHFHNASPKKNWMLYYPIEKKLAKYCDYLVTINKEDYNRAKGFKVPNVRYIPGVGVDIARIKEISIDKSEMRKSIGIPNDAILILSVGELIERKNHAVIIKAIAQLSQKNIYYAIAGKGSLKTELELLAKKLGVSERVFFLGFRNDIPQLFHAADISAFPSRIEGLGLAGIEAMAAGVPLVTSNVHGILDYVESGKTGFSVSPNDVKGFASAIKKLADDACLRQTMRKNCLKAVAPFEINNALSEMHRIYKEILT